MPILLLDTNCLIDIDQGGTARAQVLRDLVDASRRTEVELVVGAITASENAPAGTKEPFESFTARLERVGLGEARLLPPMGYWNITYWGQALWVNEEMKELERKIHAVLAPNLAMDDDSDKRR